MDGPVIVECSVPTAGAAWRWSRPGGAARRHAVSGSAAPRALPAVLDGTALWTSGRRHKNGYSSESSDLPHFFIFTANSPLLYK